MEQLCEVFELKEYYQKMQLEFQEKAAKLLEKLCDEPPSKKVKILNENADIIFENVTYNRFNYLKDTDLPKSILHLYAKKNLSLIPKYNFERKGSQFRAVMHLDDKRYSSFKWDKTKKGAEQCACLVGCLHLKLVSRQDLIDNGSLDRYEP